MLAQLHRLFHHVQPFLNNLEGCPATRANLLRVFQNSKDFEQLRLQLAITIDTGKMFVMKTYILEGDGELIVEAYSHPQEVATASALEQYPITLDTVRALANGNKPRIAQLMAKAKSKICGPSCRIFSSQIQPL